ncbi:hypothetical protein HJFPF1_10408 [Paramyrothecium foliicola]|nr:hypothetical protein HJFPF1_10408 [Paramyrothecium foliicola]
MSRALVAHRKETNQTSHEQSQNRQESYTLAVRGQEERVTTHLTASSTPGTVSTESGENSPPTERSAALSASERTLNLWEFNLLHHYIIYVAATFAPSSAECLWWCDYAISEAMKQEFLLRMTLMISCLHLGLNKSPKFSNKHQNFILAGCSESVAQFHVEAKTINKSNWRAVKPFIFLCSIYALALPMLHGRLKNAETVIDDIVQVLRLLGGAQQLAKTWKESDGKYDDGFMETKDVYGAATPIESESMIAMLKKCISISGDEAQTKAVNLEAVHALKEAADHNFIVMLRPLVWPNMVQKEYLDLITKKNPTALVILAHYAVTLHDWREKWWCADWGATLLAAVETLLPDRFREAIAYPKKKIGLFVRVNRYL